MECLYVNLVGLHVSVIHMTIIRSVRAKEFVMQQRSSERNVIVIKTTPRRCNVTIPYFKFSAFLIHFPISNNFIIQ
jgi:hypothetical protein